MKTLFISDLHLGHANCIRFDNRPWETAEEMDMEIIRRWNRKVRKEDHVYVLMTRKMFGTGKAFPAGKIQAV